MTIDEVLRLAVEGGAVLTAKSPVPGFPEIRGLVAYTELRDDAIRWRCFNGLELPGHEMVIESYTVDAEDATVVIQTNNWQLTVEGAWQRDDVQAFKKLSVPDWVKAENDQKGVYFGG